VRLQICEVPGSSIHHLKNEFDSSKAVLAGKHGQEVEPTTAHKLAALMISKEDADPKVGDAKRSRARVAPVFQYRKTLTSPEATHFSILPVFYDRPKSFLPF
jgi:hypothetical protein